MKHGTQLHSSMLGRSVIVALWIFVLVIPQCADAAFEPNTLLEDQELFDGNALSRQGIQDFLDQKGGGLRLLKFPSDDGEKSAARIIYDVGKHWNISQKYLLVRLQVEQSLVTDPTPTQRQLDWATGFGVCDSCSKDDPAIQKYKGFRKQVEWAARRIRETYLPLLASTGKIYSFGPGITTMVDGVAVTPTNNATAILYQYTPHLHGNENLVRLWRSWFFRIFPDGVLIRQSGTEKYFRIENGKKRQYRSLAIVASNENPRKAIVASSSELAAYENGDPIVFANYSLIRSPRGTVYLVVDGRRRGIVSREVFRTLGFNPEEIIRAKWADIDYYPEGTPIDITSAYPAGALLRSKETGGIAYVENGTRHAIVSRDILLSRFRNRPKITVSTEELERYPLGDPAHFADGELVTSDNDRSIYLISGGTRRPIASRDVFSRLGFQWKNIIRTSDQSLAVHPIGDPLTIDEQTQE
jgi:hypothetical protein